MTQASSDPGKPRSWQADPVQQLGPRPAWTSLHSSQLRSKQAQTQASVTKTGSLDPSQLRSKPAQTQASSDPSQLRPHPAQIQEPRLRPALIQANLHPASPNPSQLGCKPASSDPGKPRSWQADPVLQLTQASLDSGQLGPRPTKTGSLDPSQLRSKPDR